MKIQQKPNNSSSDQAASYPTVNYDVLDLSELAKHPYCKHGPTVLFSNTKKKFYSCAACRDHKQCTFYAEYNEDKPISGDKLKVWFDRYKDEFDVIHQEFSNIRAKVRKSKENERKFCQTCQKFILDMTEKTHDTHTIKSRVSNEMLKKPLAEMLKPLALNSSNAQYIFDDSSVMFIVNQITKGNYDSVLCIGTPSVFEALGESKDVKRYLLDIDDRFIQFHDDTEFAKFNMFNNHFFYGRANFLKFLAKSKNMLVVMDPPFGGIVKLVANTIECIKNDFEQQVKSDERKMDVFLLYPYFMESWIEKWLPNFKMLDYKVSYDNQKKFSMASVGLKKGSPARIFTNVALKEVELPAEEGYSLCETCSKYVAKENLHCAFCDKCPSKDGGVYTHCDLCSKCVKTSWTHCEKCEFCHLISPESDCSKSLNGKRKQQTNSSAFNGKKAKISKN